MPCLLGLQRYTKNFWEKTPVVKVDSLPFDINGEGAGKGSVRAQRCKGSYECENPKCSFKQQHGKANKV